jgi:hypothetical protein
MPLLDNQFQIRDLVLGPGTHYRVLDSTNPFQRQARSTGSGPRAWAHGSWAGSEWYDEVVIPIRIVIIEDENNSWLDLHFALSDAFRPIEDGGDVDLRFAFDGREFLMRGRPRECRPAMDLIGTGAAFVECIFVATDPFIYDGNLSEVVDITLPEYVGGFTLPVTVPFVVSGTTVGGEASLTSTGTREASLVFRIDGPVPNPKIILERNDGRIQTLTFNLTLQDNEYLIVDTAARSVLLNGTTSRRGQTATEPAGEFPMLPPGTSVVRFRADDNNQDARLSVSWRNTWN